VHRESKIEQQIFGLPHSFTPGFNPVKKIYKHLILKPGHVKMWQITTLMCSCAELSTAQKIRYENIDTRGHVPKALQLDTQQYGRNCLTLVASFPSIERRALLAQPALLSASPESTGLKWSQAALGPLDSGQSGRQ